MKKLYLLALFSVFLVACGSSRKTTNRSSKHIKSEKVSKSSSNGKRNNIVNYAKTFKGTKYKFGGTTKSGMDCSGLVYTSYKNEQIVVPRISRDMAKKGKRISLKKAMKGDLIFFQTNKSRNVINHVGLVVDISGGDILFIHSTSSKGVIISSLEERYWKEAYVEARRII